MKKLNRHILCQALDAIPAPALIIDAQHRERHVVYANPAVGKALGMHPNELIGRTSDSLADSVFDPASPEPWRPRVARGGSLELHPAALYDQPGKAGYWLLTAATADVQASPAIPPVMTTTGSFRATDLWARGLRDERTDATTGIPGRNSLLEVLMRDWSIARREQQRLSVIVFRIDELASYHNLFGRHATDTCLRRVAHAIANSLQRASDYCARVGHDRFAVLIGGMDEERVAQFAERIAQRVRDLAIHHPRSQLARYATVSWTLASEVPGVLADEPGLLEDAEARITGKAPGDASGRDDDLNVDAG
ncbi:MAG: sensor domain-containing diguanylate cyclase [Gammaproteobacteria bacterium]|nr:sensor domain-containing diguanylate cyclase [Gammaproteobacteria bacterium]